jgi:hypothetical protein
MSSGEWEENMILKSAWLPKKALGRVVGGKPGWLGRLGRNSGQVNLGQRGTR